MTTCPSDSKTGNKITLFVSVSSLPTMTQKEKNKKRLSQNRRVGKYFRNTCTRLSTHVCLCGMCAWYCVVFIVVCRVRSLSLVKEWFSRKLQLNSQKSMSALQPRIVCYTFIYVLHLMSLETTKVGGKWWLSCSFAQSGEGYQFTKKWQGKTFLNGIAK